MEIVGKPEQTERWEEDFIKRFVVYGHPFVGSPMMFAPTATPSAVSNFILDEITKAEARGRIAGMNEIGRKCLGAVSKMDVNGCGCCDQPEICTVKAARVGWNDAHAAILAVLQDNGVEIEKDSV